MPGGRERRRQRWGEKTKGGGRAEVRKGKMNKQRERG